MHARHWILPWYTMLRTAVLWYNQCTPWYYHSIPVYTTAYHGSTMVLLEQGASNGCRPSDHVHRLHGVASPPGCCCLHSPSPLALLSLKADIYSTVKRRIENNRLRHCNKCGLSEDYILELYCIGFFAHYYYNCIPCEVVLYIQQRVSRHYSKSLINKLLITNSTLYCST